MRPENHLSSADLFEIQRYVLEFSHKADSQADPFYRRAYKSAAAAYGQFAITGLSNTCLYTTQAFLFGKEIANNGQQKGIDTFKKLQNEIARVSRESNTTSAFSEYKCTGRIPFGDLFDETQAAWILTIDSPHVSPRVWHMMGVMDHKNLFALWNIRDDVTAQVTGDHSYLQFVNEDQLQQIVIRQHADHSVPFVLATFR